MTLIPFYYLYKTLKIFQIMKQLVVVILFFSCISIHAQRNLTPRSGAKRGSVFGKIDNRELKNYGLQIEGGLTYLRTKDNDRVYLDNNGRPIDYLITPKGKPGVFFDIGTAHFPTNEPRLNLLGRRIISYYDWGIGFKLFGGEESTEINRYSSQNATIPDTTTLGSGSFYNGYATGRFTLHNNYYFSKKFYLDNGLGVNFDYRVLSGKETYENFYLQQKTHNAFVAQLHYDVGLGIKIKRGGYLIPGIQIPILGMAEWNGFKPSLDWFSSNYRPILFKIKYIYLFEIKRTSTSCRDAGSEEDKKRNTEFLQGN
jgi:hypothetical protein